MAKIDIVGLTFGYDGSPDTIFEDVSLALDTTWKLGFIGRNGRGKTTFLRLLMGQYTYRGKISAPVQFHYFPPEVPNPEAMVMEVAETLIPDGELWRFYRELALLEMDEDIGGRIFSTLSRGEQTKVLLATLFMEEGRFLLIDEPTNHLDSRGRRQVSRYLQGKTGFILVSHDRTFLDGCIDHVLSLNRADIQVQRGNYSTWAENMARQNQFELAQEEKLRREVKKLSQAAMQASSWSDEVEKTKFGERVAGLKPDRGRIGHKAAKMMKRSKNLEKRRNEALEQKSSLLGNVESAQPLKLTAAPYHTSRLLTLRDVLIRYGDTPVCPPVNLEVRQGDRIALRGGNGSGKSSILKLIMGEDIPHTGQVDIGTRLNISYVPQDTSGMAGDLGEYARAQGIEESLLKTILRKLDFARSQLEKPMEQLSAGQRKKVLLARSLCQQAHLYIWDEPLNFIDLHSRMQLEELINSYKPTMIFVEHDEAFVDTISTQIVTLS